MRIADISSSRWRARRPEPTRWRRSGGAALGQAPAAAKRREVSIGGKRDQGDRRALSLRRSDVAEVVKGHAAGEERAAAAATRCSARSACRSWISRASTCRR